MDVYHVEYVSIFQLLLLRISRVNNLFVHFLLSSASSVMNTACLSVLTMTVSLVLVFLFFSFLTPLNLSIYTQHLSSSCVQVISSILFLVYPEALHTSKPPQTKLLHFCLQTIISKGLLIRLVREKKHTGVSYFDSVRAGSCAPKCQMLNWESVLSHNILKKQRGQVPTSRPDPLNNNIHNY